MAEMQSLSRLRNPRTEQKAAPVKGVDPGVDSTKDAGEDHGGADEALDSMHASDPSSKHAVISHDGYGMTSHTIDENGEKSGPTDHANMDELKSHLGKFMGESEENGGDEQGHEEPIENSGNLY